MLCSAIHVQSGRLAQAYGARAWYHDFDRWYVPNPMTPWRTRASA